MQHNRPTNLPGISRQWRSGRDWATKESACGIRKRHKLRTTFQYEDRSTSNYETSLLNELSWLQPGFTVVVVAVVIVEDRSCVPQLHGTHTSLRHAVV